MPHSIYVKKSTVSSISCVSVVTPQILPLWRAHGLSYLGSNYVGTDEFLIRQKPASKVNTASKQKAEGIHSGTGAVHSTFQKTTKTVKSDFTTSSLQYLGYLFDELQRQSGLNSDIVKGLAGFDALILFKRPTEVALRHFEALYTTFLLRLWLTSDDEPSYRFEYLKLLDYLRSTYPSDFQPLYYGSQPPVPHYHHWELEYH